MHACMYACMYVCMYLCMHVCMHGWLDGWMHACKHYIDTRESNVMSGVHQKAEDPKQPLPKEERQRRATLTGRTGALGRIFGPVCPDW